MIYVAADGYQDGQGEPGGVTVFDEGSLEPVARSQPLQDMLYLLLHPSGKFLYGVSGVVQGWLHTWRINGDQLVPAGEPMSTGGREPCHLALDPAGRHLLVANYGSTGTGSVAVLSIGADGVPGPAVTLGRQTAPGPDELRQAGSHIHQAVFAPDGEVLVVDLGADEVVSYLLVGVDLLNPVVSRTPAGSGPRHLVRLPDGRVLVSAELDSTLLRARHVDRKLVDWIATPSTGFEIVTGPANYPSDLRPDPTGQFVLLANRGADSVAALSISTGDILIEQACGAWPRQLTVACDRLYVAATNANEVNILDAATLLPASASIRIGRPMCVAVTDLAEHRG